MSWQLASFLVLALALLAGFVWYERSHPSARVLALVGTLAALAVLGRIAFAAVPNVKPTTDIVLLAGYVFGGAPGFAVGAVAALASNFFFTQGPWTPWQMAAWGSVGVAGAALAKLSGGRLGRIPLALACGLCGLAFGVIVNFGSVITVSDEDVWARYVAYQSTSLPWDLAHAAGNVAFFLLFGPALIRILRRFRTRFEFTWRPAPVPASAAPATTSPRRLVALALAAVIAGGATAPAPQQAQAASRTPVDYLQAAQNRDGGFGGAPGQRSVDLFTGWAALGLAAQGRNPADVRAGGGRSLLDYTRTHARGLSDPNADAGRVGDLERTIMVVAAARQDPRAFAGQDLVQAMRGHVGRAGVLEQSNLTAFAILALRAAQVPAADADVTAAAAWLARQQNRDGGWSFATKGGGSDVDDSAAAVQALVAAGRRSAPETRRALAFLRRQQNPDGGFPLLPGSSSNAQSTGWALQAFAAAKIPLASVRKRKSRSALAYLRSLIAPNGTVQFSRTSRQTPVWTTGTALVALAGRSFPLTPAARGAADDRGGGPILASADVPSPGGDDDGGGIPAVAVIVPLLAIAGVAGGVGLVRAKRR